MVQDESHSGRVPDDASEIAQLFRRGANGKEKAEYIATPVQKDCYLVPLSSPPCTLSQTSFLQYTEAMSDKSAKTPDPTAASADYGPAWLEVCDSIGLDRGLAADAFSQRPR